MDIDFVVVVMSTIPRKKNCVYDFVVDFKYKVKVGFF